MNKKKNIVILTAAHPYRAAGLVAYDLMQILMEFNYNVLIITNASLEKRYPNTVTLKRIPRLSIFIKILSKLIKILSKINLKFSKLSTDITIKYNPDYHMNGIQTKGSGNSVKKILNNLPYDVDAFIYLFPQNFLDTTDLAYLNHQTKAPVFWYMMDMAPMTGGCHYAWDCLGYTRQCGSCPGIYSQDDKDLTHQLWKMKKTDIESSNIIPVAASEWQLQQLQQSSLFLNTNKHKILLPIDSHAFKPGNSTEARSKLKLPQNKKILFFGAVSVGESRKGFTELCKALEILKSTLPNDIANNVHFAIAGVKNSQLENLIPFPHTFLGYLNYEDLATTYQAADFFVCPSVEDSGPMMINQSVLSGTPVVSFQMGVAADLVINNKTGFQVEIKNSQKLADAIKQMLTLPENDLKLMSDNCRKIGLASTSKANVGRQWNQILDLELANVR